MSYLVIFKDSRKQPLKVNDEQAVKIAQAKDDGEQVKVGDHFIDTSIIGEIITEEDAKDRGGSNFASDRNHQPFEPKASNATVDEYRKQIRKSLEKQPKSMYQIDDGKPMDWPALRRGMIAKGYKGAEGPFWIAEALRAKGHQLYEIVGNKKYTVG